jgi:ABC-2 type transport system permease protein
MNKTILVLRHEIYSLVSRFSFWFGVFGIPILGFLILGGVELINRNQGGETGNALAPLQEVSQVFSQEEDLRPQGFVDRSGLVKDFPVGFPSNELIAYTKENEAKIHLQDGTISAYFVIPQDYLQSGQVIVYSEEYNLINTESRSNDLALLLSYNLLSGDDDLARAIRNPIGQVERSNTDPIAAGAERNRDDMWYFFLPYGVMMLFYISIMGSAGLLLNSVAKEKENRIMEVLLVSTEPIKILMGKITGLGLVGLFQVVIWLASSLTLLTLSGRSFPIPTSAQLPPSIAAWGVLFFILGYLVYATLMAGVGALVPNLREASQATMIVIIPLMIPLFIISALIESPNSPIAVGLSLFPLTAPTTMMLRLAATNVPLWQPLVAAAGLVVTAFLVIRAVAGMYRAQTLLSGQPFKVKRFFLALAGK